MFNNAASRANTISLLVDVWTIRTFGKRYGKTHCKMLPPSLHLVAPRNGEDFISINCSIRRSTNPFRRAIRLRSGVAVETFVAGSREVT